MLWVSVEQRKHQANFGLRASNFWVLCMNQKCERLARKLVKKVFRTPTNASDLPLAGGFEALPSLTQIATDELPKIFRSGEGLNYDIGGTGLACGVCRELVSQTLTGLERCPSTWRRIALCLARHQYTKVNL